MNITEGMARFVVETNFDSIPASAWAAALVGITDNVGCMLEGSQEAAGQRAIRLAERMGGRPEATIIGSDTRNNIVTAAFTNGVSAHAIDYDDTYLPLAHPSCTLVPTALAIGEERGSSGRDLVGAYLLGYEVQARVGTYCGHGRGWHTTGTWGVMGSTAVAARLLGLSVDETRTAFGIAASSAAAAARNVGTMTKPFHAGHANRAGVVAALLAADGFTADRDIFDGAYGSFFDIYGGADAPDRSDILDGLDSEWHILNYQPGIKKYPTCYLNHRMIDTILELRQREAITFDEVERVEVSVANEQMLNNPAPETGLRAKFSFQYNAAMALQDGAIVPSTFDDQKVRSTESQQAMSKISLKVDPEVNLGNALGADAVSITLRDGKVLRHRIPAPYGNWDRPLAREDILGKFRTNASPVIGGASTEAVIELLERLPDVPDVTELTRHLGAVPTTA